MNAPALTIGRLRVHGAVREPVVARLAAEALAAEALAAPQLPPQAVLLLRRLSLNLPQRALERLPDAVLRAQVAGAARGVIAHAAARAARPALDPAQSDADAVWFGDEAEMLACLARDGLFGRLDRWWWRQLLGRSHPDWVTAWGERPALVPAALRLVARAGLRDPVLEHLAAGGITAHAAAALAGRAPHEPIPPSGPAPRHVRRQPAPRTADPAQGTPQSATASQSAAGPSGVPHANAAVGLPDPNEAARTSRTVTAAGPALPAPVPAALAPAAPAAPRADESVQARPEAPPDVAPAPPAPAGPPRGELAQASPAPAHLPADLPHGSGAPADVRSRPRGPASRTVPHASLAVQASALLPAYPAPFRARPHAPAAGPVTPAPPRVPQPTPPADGASDTVADAPLDAAPRVVITHHGRLLFLANVLLGDGLYPDFTRPLDPAFPLPLWRLLMLVGQGLAGPALRTDPLWRVLDGLAQEAAREPEAPFARGELDSLWPVPVVRTRRPTCAARRRKALASALRRPGRARRGELAGWLARYLASLRQRLAAPLGVAPALVGRAFSGGAARLWVSEAELVLVTPLADHPLAWRLAGLDRDPGPLPGAGRTLRFLFE